MHFSTILKFSTVLATAAVQVTAIQHNVTVGGVTGLVFTPQFLNAVEGDTIFFTFQQKNHTVTQSTFASPCSPLDGGFDSGFIPVSADNTNGPFPAAQFRVRNSTEPVWAYCRQGNHCKQGMVFAVNPGDKFADFKAAAMNSGGGSSTVSPPPSSTTPPTSTATSVVSSPSPTSTGTDHRVIVGSSGLTFSPNTVVAQPGDTVTFEFRPKNHTATQSTFASPCSPMSGGFTSGFKPVGTDSTTFPTYVVNVANTEPIWVYCAQGNHCTSGMVFAINAPSTGNTFDAFRAKATGGSPSTGSPSSTGSNPAPTATGATGDAGRIRIQSITGLSVVAFTSLFFLL